MIEVARLYRVDGGESHLKAFADVNINNILIKGIRVIDGKNGLFAGMPKQQARDGKWYDTVKVLDEELKQELQEVVIEAYRV
jgi:stage V sporulation protein G